jgi:hypothetical protein
MDSIKKKYGEEVQRTYAFSNSHFPRRFPVVRISGNHPAAGRKFRAPHIFLMREISPDSRGIYPGIHDYLLEIYGLKTTVFSGRSGSSGGAGSFFVSRVLGFPCYAKVILLTILRYRAGVLDGGASSSRFLVPGY